jgi:hypothetical protein
MLRKATAPEMGKHVEACGSHGRSIGAGALHCGRRVVGSFPGVVAEAGDGEREISLATEIFGMDFVSFSRIGQMLMISRRNSELRILELILPLSTASLAGRQHPDELDQE